MDYFHIQNGLFIRRVDIDDPKNTESDLKNLIGHIEVVVTTDTELPREDGANVFKKFHFDARTWAMVIATCSIQGHTAETYQEAIRLHKKGLDESKPVSKKKTK